MDTTHLSIATVGRQPLFTDEAGLRRGVHTDVDPRGDRLAEPVDRGVAGHARLPLAHHDPCLELLEAFQHHGVGPREHVDVQPSPSSPGHDRGRQRGIAAGGDRERL